MKLLLTAYLLITSQNLFAAVWQDSAVWSDQYEEEYSKWFASDAVHKDIFVSKNSPYYGITADCADASYALRAIFSYENSLPFAIKSPSGGRGENKTINNSLSRWDHLPAGPKRLIAMVNFIGASVGTEGLAHFDTYPVKISSTRAGTLFMYKYKVSLSRRYVRHSYNIKAVNPVGNFDTIYSTQAVRAAGEPLIRRKSKEFVNLPHGAWGFKRFRWPGQLGMATADLPIELEASQEQYKLVNKLGKKGFFPYVKNLLKEVDETPALKLENAIKSVCEESISRISYVDQALAFLKKTGAKCMNYRDYDTYSTPARDKSLRASFQRLKNTYRELKNSNDLRSVKPAHFNLVLALYENSDYQDQEMNNICLIKYAKNKELNLISLNARINAGLLSSHPNDSLAQRWGENVGKKTSCKRWY